MISLQRFLTIFLHALMLQTCRCQDNLQLVSGDVMISAMVSINNIENDACGDYDVDTLKEATAVKWFLDAVNDMNYIPGVKIGLELFRTCQSGEFATRNAVHMLEKFRVLNDDSQDLNSTVPFIGLLGPGRTQEAMDVSRFLSSLPASQRPLQIAASATGAALADKNVYSNLFRVIPPDSTQVQVLFQLLQQLGWNYIAIVYEDDAYGREAARELKELANRHNLCVPSFVSLPLDYRSTEFISTADNIIDRLRGGSLSIINGVVYIGGAATASLFISRVANSVSFVRFIFSEALGLQTSVVSGTVVGKGALAAAPPYLPLPEFRIFWNNIWTDWTIFTAEMQRNAWLAEYYTTITACSISDANCWSQNQDKLPQIPFNPQWFFEYYHVKAAAVFAAVLKKLHSQTCGQGHNGVCLRLKQVMRNERDSIQNTVQNSVLDLEAEFSSVSSIFSGQTNVGFNEQGEITSGEHNGSLYNVFNYRECSSQSDFCFQQVGAYKVDGQLQLDTQTIRGYDDTGNSLLWSNFPKAQCMNGHDCLECLPQDIPGEIVFVPGDFYIVAIAPVHDRVSKRPLECGDMRKSSGADFVQSILFAVENVNKKNKPFNGVFGSKTMGVVILNSCYRELVIKDRLIDLHKGTLVLPDGRNSSDILPYIAGYVGAFFSTISIAMYEVLSQLEGHFVLMSPTNTSPELSDRTKYPQYLRLTTGENAQVPALLTLIKDLGHQYVQVVYDPVDTYTTAVKERINALSLSKPYNICVVNNIASDSEEQSFYPVLDDLRKNLWAPVVIMALQAEHIKKVMDNILPQMTASDKFLFVGTDGWARSSDVLTSQDKRKLVGSLTFSVELPLNQLFGEELKTTDPLNTTNPWLKYFWEARKECYFDGSFRRKGKTGQCPQDLTADYTQDTWVPFYINAVYAFAQGLNSAMTEHCQQGVLCDALTSQRLLDGIKAVRLDLFNTGVDVNVFDSNGDGDVGYKVFQVTTDVSSPSADDLTYEEVGRYEHGSLVLNRDKLWALKNLDPGQCPNPRACNACFPVVPKPGNDASTSNDSDDGAIIATVVIIVILVIIVVVLVVVLVLTYRRLKTLGNASNDKFAFDNLAVSQSPDARVHSRPLPPVNGSSGSFGTSRASASSGSAGDRESSPNTYDYLQHSLPDEPQAHRARLSYQHLSHQPDRGSGGSMNAPSSISREPNSSGYVTRDSGGHAPYDLARHVGGRQNSRVGGNSNQSGGSVAPRPLVFENGSEDSVASSTTSPPLPEPCMPSDDPNYLTPLSEYLEPVKRSSYVDMEGTVATII